MHWFRVPLLTRKALARYQANPRKRGGAAHLKLIAKTIQQLTEGGTHGHHRPEIRHHYDAE